jgi:hypothetical protein
MSGMLFSREKRRQRVKDVESLKIEERMLII